MLREAAKLNPDDEEIREKLMDVYFAAGDYAQARECASSIEQFRMIAAALEAKHAPCRVILHHRVGDLAIGEIAVIVVAGAPHRDAAFKAAREAIDELKTVVPIWKKEYAEDGAVWIDEHA